MARRQSLLPGNRVLLDALKRTKGCTFFGVPVAKLTKDELLAAAVLGWEAYRELLAKQANPFFIVSTKGEVMAFGGN